MQNNRACSLKGKRCWLFLWVEMLWEWKEHDVLKLLVQKMYIYYIVLVLQPPSLDWIYTILSHIILFSVWIYFISSTRKLGWEKYFHVWIKNMKSTYVRLFIVRHTYIHARRLNIVAFISPIAEQVRKKRRQSGYGTHVLFIVLFLLPSFL